MKRKIERERLSVAGRAGEADESKANGERNRPICTDSLEIEEKMDKKEWVERKIGRIGRSNDRKATL